MKKLSVLLSIVLLACSLSLSAFAADEAVATITGATAKAGDEITLTVSVKNSPAIVGAQFIIGYDSAVMSFVSASVLDSSFFASCSDVAGANPVKITIANLGLVEKSGDITVASVTFKLADDVKAGNYTVSLSVPEAYNAKITPVRIPTEDSIVSVGSSDHTHSFAKEKGEKTVSAPVYTKFTCECGHAYTGKYGSPDVEVKMTVNSFTAYVNGLATTLDAAPVIKNSRTMLPVRFVAENLGASVGWDDATRTVTVESTLAFIEITIGSSVAKVNGEPISLDSPAYIDASNNRTYLPVRFVAENLGADVSWDDTTKTATLVK